MINFKLWLTKLHYFFLYTISTLSAQVIEFGWGTAVDNGDNTTETISGVTTTVSGLPGITIAGCLGCLGTTGSFVESVSNNSSITFTFSEPVKVNSVLAVEGNSGNVDYTFTPTGGSNDVVVASLLSGTATVDLNWLLVTSFTVTSSDATSIFGFDDLSIQNPSLSASDFTINDLKIYPNPVKNSLFLSNIENLITLKVFNSLGQLVIETDNREINFSDLDNGIYFLQIKTLEGTATRKILKE